MLRSLASQGRYWSEFVNNGRAEFCEMWNALLDRASFGILRAAVRLAFIVFLFLFDRCLILYGYDLSMS